MRLVYKMQDPDRRLSGKNLARSCTIDVEKGLRKKCNVKVELTQRSISLMCSDLRSELSVQTETFISLLS